MSGHSHFQALFLVVLVSVVGPALAVRVRLPAAVILILTGIAVGPAGLTWVEDGAALSLLSELGFLVLMFAAGMEIDFDSLRGVGGREGESGLRSLVLPGIAVAGFTAIAVGYGLYRGLSVIDWLVLSASSVGMPLAVLQETRQIQRPLGRYVLITASIGEFVSILGVTGYEVFAEDATLGHRALKLVKVIVLFAISATLIRWARATVWWWPKPFRRLTQHHDVAELGVRTGLLVMFGFVVIAATFGVEPILGAFIAGALVAFVLREKHALEGKIAALGHGLFIPIFFIMVGVRFDLRVLDFGALRDAAALVGVVAAVKILPVLVSAPRTLGLRQRLAAGSLLAAPLTLVVAIAAIGRRLGTLDPTREGAFVLLAIMLSVGFPVVFRLLVGSSGEAHEAEHG